MVLKIKLLPLKNLFTICIILFLFSCKEKIKPKISSSFNADDFTALISDVKDDSLSTKIRLIKADSAVNIAKRLNNDSIYFLALSKKAELFSDLKMHDQAKSLNQKILSWSNNLDHKKYFAEANFNYGRYFYKALNQDDSAYYYYNHAKSEFYNLNDSLGVAKTSLNMSVILNEIGYYAESEDLAMDALKKLSTKEADHPYYIPVYNALALSSGSLLNYEEELYWYDKALLIVNNPYYEVSLKNNKAVANTVLKNYDKAIEILESIKDAKILESEINLNSRIIDNLAYVKWLKNPSLDVLDEFNLALKIRKEADDKSGMISSYDHLSEYFAQTNPKKAIDYAQKMYELSKQIDTSEDKLKALKRLIDLKKGSDKEEIAEYIRLNDSLQLVTSQSKYKFAKLRYDAEANRKKVFDLSLKDTENTLQLERAKIYIVIFVSCFIIGLVSFTYYVLIIRQKRKQERLNIIYETEVALSQKLHDELANDLFSTITLVDRIKFSDASIKQKLIHNLDHIYSQTRTISRQNNTIDTINFKEELDTMLGSYKSDQVNVLSKGIDQIDWDQIENNIKITIYRVLMEFMINMKKHSNCNLVVLKFEVRDKLLIINYIDNGTVEIVGNIRDKNGIKNVENRIHSVRGTINFDLLKGFRITLTIPI